MHELSIALSILDIAAEESERQGGARVAAIHLKLGPLSGVVKEALLSAFELAREESAMDQCELVIQDIPITVFCPSCGGPQAAVSPQSISCSVCGTPTPDILTGTEMEIVAMEVFSEQPNPVG